MVNPAFPLSKGKQKRIGGRGKGTSDEYEKTKETDDKKVGRRGYRAAPRYYEGR
jgi:hypothetical protein